MGDHRGDKVLSTMVDLCQMPKLGDIAPSSVVQLSSGGMDGPAQIPAVVYLHDCHSLKGGPQPTVQLCKDSSSSKTSCKPEKSYATYMSYLESTGHMRRAFNF